MSEKPLSELIDRIDTAYAEAKKEPANYCDLDDLILIHWPRISAALKAYQDILICSLSSRNKGEICPACASVFDEGTLKKCGGEIYSERDQYKREADYLTSSLYDHLVDLEESCRAMRHKIDTADKIRKGET